MAGYRGTGQPAPAHGSGADFVSESFPSKHKVLGSSPSCCFGFETDLALQAWLAGAQAAVNSPQSCWSFQELGPQVCQQPCLLSAPQMHRPSGAVPRAFEPMGAQGRSTLWRLCGLGISASSLTSPLTLPTNTVVSLSKAPGDPTGCSPQKRAAWPPGFSDKLLTGKGRSCAWPRQAMLSLPPSVRAPSPVRAVTQDSGALERAGCREECGGRGRVTRGRVRMCVCVRVSQLGDTWGAGSRRNWKGDGPGSGGSGSRDFRPAPLFLSLHLVALTLSPDRPWGLLSPALTPPQQLPGAASDP